VIVDLFSEHVNLQFTKMMCVETSAMKWVVWLSF